MTRQDLLPEREAPALLVSELPRSTAAVNCNCGRSPSGGVLP